jgi:hypothetical protein
LEACLLSHLESGRRHGRECVYVVIDDSDAPATREANLQVLRALRGRYGSDIAYADSEAKARFSEVLAREAGLPEETVRFALVNDEGCSIATGGSRNALLLHAAGETLLQVDDDTLCRVVPTPGARPGLAFSSRPDPTDFWFFPEADPEPAADHFVEENLVALHEQLLGKRLGDCFPTKGDTPPDQANSGLLRRPEVDGGRVLATAAGVVGDSGMGSSLHLLTLEGESRARLLASERDYRHAVARRRVLRAVTQATISDGAFCMGLNLGLDNRELLPPFLPVQRNQDGVFAVVLRCCFRDGFFGFLPRAILHRPPSPRGGKTGVSWAEAVRPQTGHLFQVLVGAAASRSAVVDAGKKLVDLGRALADVAAVPAHCEEVTRSLLSRALGGWADRLDARVRATGGLPAYWAEDARQAVTAARTALQGPDLGVPWDLRAAFGVGRARELAPRLVGRFGRLLQAWPAMVEAARTLRARGVRLAQSV